jgi:hypothetical protein
LRTGKCQTTPWVGCHAPPIVYVPRREPADDDGANCRNKGSLFQVAKEACDPWPYGLGNRVQFVGFATRKPLTLLGEGTPVNQPPHGFEGSSPSSPTSLRSLRELRLGRPVRSFVAKRAKAAAPKPKGRRRAWGRKLSKPSCQDVSAMARAQPRDERTQPRPFRDAKAGVAQQHHLRCRDDLACL